MQVMLSFPLEKSSFHTKVFFSENLQELCTIRRAEKKVLSIILNRRETNKMGNNYSNQKEKIKVIHLKKKEYGISTIRGRV